VKHRIEHTLGRERAKELADQAWAHYRTRHSRFSPEAQWDEPYRARITFHALGAKLEGFATFEEQAVVIDFKVPLLLKPFEKQAVQLVETEVRTWLDKA
jgi:hypothetical protein